MTPREAAMQTLLAGLGELTPRQLVHCISTLSDLTVPILYTGSPAPYCLDPSDRAELIDTCQAILYVETTP